MLIMFRLVLLCVVVVLTCVPICPCILLCIVVIQKNAAPAAATVIINNSTTAITGVIAFLSIKINRCNNNLNTYLEIQVDVCSEPPGNVTLKKREANLPKSSYNLKTISKFCPKTSSTQNPLRR